MPHAAPSLCVHRPPLRRLALLATPVGGTRRQFRRTSSIAFEGEQLGFRAVPESVRDRTGQASFGRRRFYLKMQSKKITLFTILKEYRYEEIS